MARLATRSAVLGRRARPTLQLLPTVMASPPTVTVTNDTNLASTISSPDDGTWVGTYHPDDFGWYRPLRGTWTPYLGGSFPSQYALGWDGDHGSPNVVRAEFIFDGRYFEPIFRQTPGCAYRIIVDGQLATSGANVLGGTPGNSGNMLVDLGSRATRRIIVEGTGTASWFYGAWVQLGDTIVATPVHTRRLVIVGDSYMGGANGVSVLECAASWLAYSLGFTDWANISIGGSGWRVSGSGTDVLVNRVTSDIIDQAPTDIVFCVGHNDDAEAAEDMQTTVSSILTTIRANLARLSNLYVTGPIFQGGLATYYRATEAAIRIGGAATYDQFVSTTQAPIFTGTGNTNTPVGDGNSDVYIGSDGVHPTVAGARYLGRQLALRIYAAGFTVPT